MRRCRNYEILTLVDARNPNKSEQNRLKYDKYQSIMFLSRLFDQVHHHVYVHAHVHVLVRLHVNLHVCKHVNAHVHCPCTLCSCTNTFLCTHSYMNVFVFMFVSMFNVHAVICTNMFVYIFVFILQTLFIITTIYEAINAAILFV